MNHEAKVKIKFLLCPKIENSFLDIIPRYWYCFLVKYLTDTPDQFLETLLQEVRDDTVVTFSLYMLYELRNVDTVSRPTLY